MSSSRCHECRVLVSDIDGTLLDDGRPTTGLENLRATLAITNHQVRLVYATGRTFESTWELIEAGILPLPDAIAPLVGSEVWFPPWRSYDASYAGQIDHGWNREVVLNALAGLPGLELQPEKFQSPWKMSFFTDEPSTVQLIEKRLQQKNIVAKTVYSCSRYLDVMPPSAGKLSATDFILKQWGIPRDQAIACGDSGNDLDMLTAQNLAGVIVGNAEKELLSLPSGDSLYRSDDQHAAGVLEGAESFDFWPS